MNYDVKSIPIAEIYMDDSLNDARGRVLPMDVVDLARDIKESGLQQPIIVQPWSHPEKPEIKYRAIAGHRRLTAFKVNRELSIPAFINAAPMSELALRSINLKENLLRKDLDIVQQAVAIKPYIIAGWTEKDIATEFQQSVIWVQVRKVVLISPKDIQEELRAGLLTPDQIRKMGRLKTDTDKYAFIRAAKEHHQKGKEVKVKPSKIIKPEERKLRRADDIHAMNAHLLKVLDGANLATYALAWAAGTLSDLEFAVQLKQYCEDNLLEFEEFPSMSR